MEKEKWDSFAWQQVFDALDDLIFIINPDYSIHKINQKARKFLDIDENSLQSIKCHRLLFDKDAPCENCQLSDVEDWFNCHIAEEPIQLKDHFFKVKTHPVKEENSTDKKLIVFLYDVTEEVKALTGLKETEAKYNLITENSSDLITLMDQNLQFTYASPSVRSMGGYTPEEFIKLRLDDILVPESYQKVRALYATDKTREKTTGVYQAIRKDKIVCWIEMATTPLRNDKGEIIGYIAQSRDVSDKKKALDALKASEERYNLVQENSEIRISYLTPEGNVVFMNRISAKHFNGEPEDFTGKNIAELFPPHEAARQLERLTQVLKKSKPVDFEDEYVFENQKKHVISTFSRVTDSEGIPVGILVTIKDITKLKIADEKIKQSEEQLKSLLKITQMDHLSQYELLNHALEEALKFTRSEIGSLYHYDEKTETFNLNSWSESVTRICEIKEKQTRLKMEELGVWGEAVKKREPIIYNNYKTTENQPKGHPTIKNYISIPVFWDHRIVALISLANKPMDFSESDIQQVQLLMNTVWKIIERNRTEKELIQAKEKAEESDHLKSAFLSNMSHEIRTPINGIMGFLNLMKEEELSEETKGEFLELIDRNFNHLMILISDIIDISKLESNQVKLNKSNVHVNNLVRDVIKLCRTENPLLKKKNVTINTHLPNPTLLNPIVTTDKVRLRQILLNLLDNSVKFTHEGEIRIEYQKDGSFLRFCVEDSGIGIEPEHHKIIFDHFRQGDDTLTRKYGGAGLGLSITKKLVELLGGKIWVESERGKYSKFYFTIPYLPVEKKFVGRTFPALDMAVNLKGRSILIVEDDDSNFLFLREVFKNTEAIILRSSSCEETIHLLKQNYPIHLVLLDIRLPDGNGLDLLPKIRRSYPNAPIIAQTAFAFESDRKQYIDAGCDDYVTKPINEIMLLKLVEEKIWKTPRIKDRNTNGDSGMAREQE